MGDAIETRPAEAPHGAPRPAPEEKVDTDHLTRQAGRGALWQILGGGWHSFVRLAGSTILARALAPEDFGLFGMAVLVQGLIARVGALGTGNGVIARKNPTQTDLSTAFWMNVTVQVFMFAVAFAGAPLAAAFFDAPTLTSVLRVTAACFLINGFSSMTGVLMSKRLQFGRARLIQSGAVVIQTGLAIVLVVWLDMGYWALVIALVVSNLAAGVARVVVVGWLPSLAFDRGSFRYFLRFGLNGLGSATVSYLRSNIDYLLVGRLLGSASLGFYEFAYRIPHLVLEKTASPVGHVLFPVLAQLKGEDNRLAAAYVKTAKYISLMVFPAMGGLAVLARPIVLVLWGEQWLPIVVPLRILCFSAAVRSVLASVGSIFLCKDRPDLPFKFGLMNLCLTVAAVGGLGWFFGLIGVAAGMAVATLPGLAFLYLAFRMTRYPVGGFVRAMAPAGMSTAVCAAAAWLCSAVLQGGGLHVGIALPSAIAAGVGGYAGALALFYPADLKETWKTVGTVIGARPKQRGPKPRPEGGDQQ